MNSFQRDMQQSHVMSKPPCEDCGLWHQGFCPVRPGDEVAPNDPKAAKDWAEVAGFYGGPVASARVKSGQTHVVMMRNGQRVMFERADLYGEWVHLFAISHLIATNGWPTDNPPTQLWVPVREIAWQYTIIEGETHGDTTANPHPNPATPA